MKNDIKLHPFRHIWGNIISGIFVVLPLITTLYVFIKLFSLADSFLPSLVHSFFEKAPQQWAPGVGIVIVLVLAYFVGRVSKAWVGKKILRVGNGIITSIPLINKFYVGVQQIIDAFSGNKKFFNKPVLIEFPKPNSYCIAFLTSEEQWEISEKTGRELVSVFIPTTPNPTNGFLLFIPKQDVIRLNMNIEGSIKTIMSFGAVTPEKMAQGADGVKKSFSMQEVFDFFNRRGKNKTGKPRSPSDPRD